MKRIVATLAFMCIWFAGKSILDDLFEAAHETRNTRLEYIDKTVDQLIRGDSDGHND